MSDEQETLESTESAPPPSQEPDKPDPALQSVEERALESDQADSSLQSEIQKRDSLEDED